MKRLQLTFEKVMIIAVLAFCALQLSMSWASAAVIAVLVAGKALSVWLESAAARAIREEQREERETGAVAQLTGRFEALEALSKQLQVDWKAFAANNRR